MSRTDFSLPNRAAEKVKLSLDEVFCLTDDFGEKLRIALMGAAVPIGSASVILAAKMRREGHECSDAQAKEYIFKLLQTMVLDGADAAMSMLNRQ